MGTGRPDEILEVAEPGRVLTVFCDDVAAARPLLREAAEQQPTIPTLVALEWTEAPPLARELDEIRDALARAAQSLWPNWYITAEQRFEITRAPNHPLAKVVQEAQRTSPKASPSWLRAAWKLCASGELPIVDNMVLAEQVRQLSRALDPASLVFAVSVAATNAPAARVRGLAKATEWLAHESRARTLLLVPQSWRGDVELDYVTYGARALCTAEDVSNGHVGGTVPPMHCRPPATAGSPPMAPADACAPQVVVGPIVGKPHPGSEVEQLLHDLIVADAQLQHLFEFNQRLKPASGNAYIVDLVWRHGRLIVEIDGPEHYKNHRNYLKDRDRDFEFFMSGYTTLRIANAEALANQDKALAKIKSVVGRLQDGQKGTQPQ